MITVRTLPVKLTREELEQRAKDLAKHTRDKAEAELQKKDVVAQITSTIKSCEAQLDKLAQAINTGVEYREVKCSWDYDYERGVKWLSRDDTGAEVERQTISESEKQLRLDEATA
jgi:hypothetical protein